MNPWRFHFLKKGDFWDRWNAGWQAGEEVSTLRLKVNGPLTLKGASRWRVVVLGSRRVRSGEGEAEVRASGPVVVEVPPYGTVIAEGVNGPVGGKDLEGALRLKKINGPVSLRGAGEVHLGEVRGPLTLRAVRGAVGGQGPRGPLTLAGCTGTVRLETPVHGPVSLRGVTGDVDLTARGKVLAVLAPQPGQQIRLRSDKDLRLTLPPEASARLTAQAGGALRTDLPQVEPQGNRLEVTLGAGEAVIDLWAAGDLEVTVGAFSDEPLAASEEEPKAWAEEWWPEDWESAVRVQQAPHRVGRQKGEEEPLTVLRMLAQGKITAEQAEQLLQALEGEE